MSAKASLADMRHTASTWAARRTIEGKTDVGTRARLHVQTSFLLSLAFALRLAVAPLQIARRLVPLLLTLADF